MAKNKWIKWLGVGIFSWLLIDIGVVSAFCQSADKVRVPTSLVKSVASFIEVVCSEKSIGEIPTAQIDLFLPLNRGASVNDALEAQRKTISPDAVAYENYIRLSSFDGHSCIIVLEFLNVEGDLMRSRPFKFQFRDHKWSWFE